MTRIADIDIHIVRQYRIRDIHLQDDGFSSCPFVIRNLDILFKHAITIAGSEQQDDEQSEDSGNAATRCSVQLIHLPVGYWSLPGALRGGRLDGVGFDGGVGGAGGGVVLFGTSLPLEPGA